MRNCLKLLTNQYFVKKDYNLGYIKGIEIIRKNGSIMVTTKHENNEPWAIIKVEKLDGCGYYVLFDVKNVFSTIRASRMKSIKPPEYGTLLNSIKIMMENDLKEPENESCRNDKAFPKYEAFFKEVFSNNNLKRVINHLMFYEEGL